MMKNEPLLEITESLAREKFGAMPFDELKEYGVKATALYLMHDMDGAEFLAADLEDESGECPGTWDAETQSWGWF